MTALHFTASAGRDGVLRLEIPAPEGNYDVTISPVPIRNTFVPMNGGDRDYVPKEELLREDVFLTATDRGWPPGFFEQTMGSIDDDSFVRHPQGEYEIRLSFDEDD